ncbi:MAG: sigma-70 family RNA polymerase sigma factor [Caulobacteraceae bacterium]|nr:sigma-70 family RNA polymerase sigma factor [Caulobacteraceae bacterium]
MSGSSVLDAKTIDALSRRSRTALRRYFERRGLVGADAEDAIQDVFVRLSLRAGIVEATNIDGYLFETAASVTIDHFRRRNARFLQLHDEFQDDVHAPREERSAEQVMLAREMLETIALALRELPERTRAIFLLSRLEGLKRAEIAKRLGLSVSAVEKHLVKAAVHLTRRTRRLR